MSILDTIFDAGARRRKKLADLVAARVQLQAAYDDAIAGGADIDKPQAKLAKHDAEIAAAQAVVDATEAAAERARQSEKLSAREVAEREAVLTFEDYAREATAFEALVLGGPNSAESISVLGQWAQVEASAEIAFAAERRSTFLGSTLRTMTGKGIGPGDIWTRIWMSFMRQVNKSGGTYRQFPSGRSTYVHDTVATLLGRELAHHRQSIKETTE